MTENRNGKTEAGAMQEGAKPKRLTRRRLVIGGAVLAMLLLGAALVFKPWLLFVDKTVDDELPDVVASAQAEPGAGATDAMGPMGGGMDGMKDMQGADDASRVVATGTFISHEHETSGTALIVRGTDGSHKLVLRDLRTSNGPDVHVWLSAGPVVEGKDGFFTAKNHDHLDVSMIKGNIGNQVYDLPADVDLDKWKSVVLWCEDFNVSFGAAELHSA